MSHPTPSTPTPIGEIPAQFGGPATPDLAGEYKKLESMCTELLAEREKLRAEMAQLQREHDACRMALFHQLCKDYKPDFDEAIGFAHLDDRPTLEEIIAELKNAPEKRACPTRSARIA